MSQPTIPACPGPLEPVRPKIPTPPKACDTHAHVFGPGSRFPYAETRSYTPPDAPLQKYLHMLDTLGVERAVLVQPSVYGTDNTAMLDAMKAAGGRLRGVAVVAEDVSDEELGKLDAAGVRGVRLPQASGR